MITVRSTVIPRPTLRSVWPRDIPRRAVCDRWDSALGAPIVPRWAGLWIGGLALRAVHHLPSSLLIAREAPLPSGDQIVLALDGADEASPRIQPGRARPIHVGREGQRQRFRPDPGHKPADSQPDLLAQSGTGSEAGSRDSVHDQPRRQPAERAPQLDSRWRAAWATERWCLTGQARPRTR